MDLLKGCIQRYIFTRGSLKDPHKSLTYIFIPLNTIKFSKSNLIFSVLLFSLSLSNRRVDSRCGQRKAAGAAGRRQRQRWLPPALGGGWRATLGRRERWRWAAGWSGAPRCQERWLQHGRVDPPPPDHESGGGGRQIHRLRPREWRRRQADPPPPTSAS